MEQKLKEYDLKKLFLSAVIALGFLLLVGEVFSWLTYNSLQNKMQGMIQKNEALIMNHLDETEKLHSRLANRFKERTEAFNKKFESYAPKKEIVCNREEQLAMSAFLRHVLKDSQKDLDIEGLKSLQMKLRALDARMDRYVKDYPKC